MRFLILFALIAACSAATIFVNTDGTSTFYSGVTGRRVVIQQHVGQPGYDFVQIYVSGPSIRPQTIQFVDNVEGKSQVYFLNQILAEFQGIVDPSQYQILLGRVQLAVNQGQVIPQIYELLDGLVQVRFNSVWQSVQQGSYVDDSLVGYNTIPQYYKYFGYQQVPYVQKQGVQSVIPYSQTQQVPYYQGQQVYQNQIPYSTGYRGSFSYLYSQPIYQNYGVGYQGYQKYQVPQVIY